jgi:hypothetical protein
MSASNNSKKRKHLLFQLLSNAWSVVPFCSHPFFQTPSPHQCAIYIDGGQQVCFSMFSVAFLICSVGIHVTLSPVSPPVSTVTSPTNSMSPSASLLLSQLPFRYRPGFVQSSHCGSRWGVVVMLRSCILPRYSTLLDEECRQSERPHVVRFYHS